MLVDDNLGTGMLVVFMIKRQKCGDVTEPPLNKLLKVFCKDTCETFVVEEERNIFWGKP